MSSLFSSMFKRSVTLKEAEPSIPHLSKKSLAIAHIIDSAKIQLLQGLTALQAGLDFISVHELSGLLVRYNQLSMHCSKVASEKSFKNAKKFYNDCAAFQKHVDLVSSHFAEKASQASNEATDSSSSTSEASSSSSESILSQTVVESEAAAEVAEEEGEHSGELVPNNIAPPATCTDSTIKNRNLLNVTNVQRTASCRF